MKVSQLATELTLLTLLVEIARNGTCYAKWEKEHRTQEAHQSARMNNEKLTAVSSVLASILPGICPAQVTAGFEKFAASGKDPHRGFDEDDVIELLATIENAWKDNAR
jgi:hypothetical protein